MSSLEQIEEIEEIEEIEKFFNESFDKIDVGSIMIYEYCIKNNLSIPNWLTIRFSKFPGYSEQNNEFYYFKPLKDADFSEIFIWAAQNLESWSVCGVLSRLVLILNQKEDSIKFILRWGEYILNIEET